MLVLAGVGLLALPALAQGDKEAAYRAFPYFGSRLAIWVIAQLHLDFAAFILGVPIFAVIIEFMAWKIGTDKPEGQRYDWLAHQFVKLTFAAFSTTALLGGLLLFLLITLYPKFWVYMSGIFAPTMWLYAALFFLETFAVYLRAKGKADAELQASGLDYTIIRPGRLTDDPGSGRVTLAEQVDRGQVSRDDVAAVLVAALDEPATIGKTLALVSGETPIEEAVR